MDPLLDEKIVLTLSRAGSEYLSIGLEANAEREAYGPSRNEGLCYESCSMVDFEGAVNGQLYLCMDGYTRMKLLPRIARRYQVDPDSRDMARSVLLEFANQLAASLINELQEGGFQIELGIPENLDNKLVAIDPSRYRQYILIYFIADRTIQRYLGRIYLILTIEKFTSNK